MNKRKLIYFLSAFVVIVGCYALNLSYSLFTQNVSSENNVVDSTIPIINASLEEDTFSIPANSDKLVKLKIINSSTIDVFYGISIEDKKGTSIKLVDGFSIIGTLKSSEVENQSSKKEVWFYVTNPTDKDIEDLTFKLNTKYTTMSFDENEYIKSSNFDKNQDGALDTTKTLSGSILTNAKTATGNSTKLSEPETVIGSNSSETERILAIAMDDYGDSYYFRGNVIDNYVNYSGMCWRIVRIEGNGNTKLVLADENNECDDIEGNDKNGNGNYYSTFNGTSALINSGQEYSFPIVLTQNAAKESLENMLNTWGNSKILDKTVLVDAEWCIDKSLEDISNPIKFSANNRINNPTLMCNITGVENTTSLVYYEKNVSYLGMLTIDEVRLAGLSSESNVNNYLYTNTSGITKAYWTLTPDYIYYSNTGTFNGEYNNSELFETIDQGVFAITKNGELDSSGNITYNYDGNLLGTGPLSVRPVIVIKNTAKITTKEDILSNGLPGTSNNPYTIIN